MNLTLFGRGLKPPNPSKMPQITPNEIKIGMRFIYKEKVKAKQKKTIRNTESCLVLALCTG